MRGAPGPEGGYLVLVPDALGGNLEGGSGPVHRHSYFQLFFTILFYEI